MSNETTSTDNLNALAQTATSRRAFLRTAGFSAVSAGALVACGKAANAKPAEVATAAAAPAAAPPVPPAATIRAAADAMDAMHKKGIKAFPAKTAGKGN